MTAAANSFAFLARMLAGLEIRGCLPRKGHAPRIYAANHTSHADFVALWAALPAHVRARTHPVAAADYWMRGAWRSYLALKIFQAVLVERHPHARDPLEPLRNALAEGKSLILFPEGTRGDGAQPRPFKCGIYHLASQYRGVEIVPVWIANSCRVLPRGAVLPVPMLCSVTFGEPVWLRCGETKQEFLERLRAAVIAAGDRCPNSSRY